MSDPEEEEYNPFEHRKVSHPTTDMDTMVHLLKGSLGSGILAMPLAFANAGLILGLILTIITGFICTYCVHILVKSAHELCRRTRTPSLDFSDIGEVAFLAGPDRYKGLAKVARFLIDFFLVTDLLGCCCVYIVFVAKNVKQVCDFYHPDDNHYDLRLYMAAMLPFLVVMNLIRQLKFLAPLSLIANIFLAASIGVTFYYTFTDLPPFEDRPAVVSITKLPLFFGTCIFALEAIGVIMSLENNMKNPDHFIGCPGVLPISMTMVVALYASTGFFGYWKYGELTEGSITLNLPQDQRLAQSVKLMIAIAIFFTYALQFYVPMSIIWRGVKDNFSEGKQNLANYVLRITLVLSTGIVSIILPNLGGLISLVGAVCLSMLGLIFPAIIELITFYQPSTGLINWMVCKNIFLVIFGLVGFVTGSYASLLEIIEDYGKL